MKMLVNSIQDMGAFTVVPIVFLQPATPYESSGLLLCYYWRREIFGIIQLLVGEFYSCAVDKVLTISPTYIPNSYNIRVVHQSCAILAYIVCNI